MSLNKAQREAISHELIRRGDLSHLLHADQQMVLSAWLDSTARRFVLEIARRWGKTYLLLCVALMVAIRKQGRVVYGAPTLKHLKEFVLPTLDTIAQQFPRDMRPKFNHGNSHIEIPGCAGWIHLFGADDERQADTGAGSDAELAVFDECGANGVASLLSYILKSIFGPSLLMTGGRMLLGSSPARVPEHDFTVMAEMAEAQGAYMRRTIHDNPRLSEKQKRDFIEADARDEGMTPEQYVLTDTFRREHLAERVVDRLLTVLPEWTDKREACRVIVPRPDYFDAHTILDPGGADPHAVMFGYWHFGLAKWVLEDEVLMRDSENTHDLSQAIKAKERELYGTDRWDGTVRAFAENELEMLSHLPDWMKEAWLKAAPLNPRVRYMDGSNLTMCRDLYSLHGLAFIPTAKDDLQAQVNNLRVAVRSDEVLMHPRCVHTDRHWRTTTWANHRRKEFARRAGEHGDLLACGIYGCRNLNKQRNPTPRRHEPSSLASRVALAYRR